MNVKYIILIEFVCLEVKLLYMAGCPLVTHSIPLLKIMVQELYSCNKKTLNLVQNMFLETPIINRKIFAMCYFFSSLNNFCFSLCPSTMENSFFLYHYYYNFYCFYFFLTVWMSVSIASLLCTVLVFFKVLYRNWRYWSFYVFSHDYLGK